MPKDTVGRELHRVEIATDGGFHGVYWVADWSPLPGYSAEAQISAIREKICRVTGEFPNLIGVES